MLVDQTDRLGAELAWTAFCLGGEHEQEWRELLAAEGVDDWVVLHGGATAVSSVPSLGESAQLAEAVVRIPGIEGSGALLTIADDRLSVRLPQEVRLAIAARPDSIDVGFCRAALGYEPVADDNASIRLATARRSG